MIFAQRHAINKVVSKKEIKNNRKYLKKEGNEKIIRMIISGRCFPIRCAVKLFIYKFINI